VAQPIANAVSPRDPRIELQTRLQNAPAEHAEAMLAVYDVLQELHDSGAFDVIRAALASRDKLLEIAVTAANSPTSIRAIRNSLVLIDMLGAIEPDVLKSFTQAAPDALKMMLRQPERPGLWMLIKDFLWNQDFRHGLAAVNTMLEVFGKSWSNGRQTHEESAEVPS
jgi:uncharacterized protein YjgD (DUF1641 family)